MMAEWSFAMHDDRTPSDNSDRLPAIIVRLDLIAGTSCRQHLSDAAGNERAAHATDLNVSQ
jgi:hypothetical protein